MSAIISTLVCLLLSITSLKICKKWLNPVAAFSSLWMVIFFLSSLSLYNLKEIAESTYWVLLFGVISFAFGFYIWLSIKKKYKFRKLIDHKNKINIQYEPRYLLLYLFGVIVILYNSSNLIIPLKLIINGSGLDVIRNMAQNTNRSTSGTLLNVINNLIISPFTFALLPITAMDIVLGKRDKKLLVLTGVIIISKLLSDGGRVQILYFGIHIFVAFIIGTNKKKINLDILRSRKNKRMFISAVIILGILIIVTSLSRAGDNLLIFTYYYFSMQPVMFEQWSIETGKLLGFGVASLNGIIFPFLYLIKNLFKLSYPNHFYSIFELIQKTDNQWKIIAGQNIKANAYVSLFWFFYTDARILGIGLYSFIYGAFCGGNYADVLKNNNVKVLSIYAYILQGVIFSFVRFQFATMAYALGFIYLCFFGYSRKQRMMYNEQK